MRWLIVAAVSVCAAAPIAACVDSSSRAPVERRSVARSAFTASGEIAVGGVLLGVDSSTHWRPGVWRLVDQHLAVYADYRLVDDSARTYFSRVTDSAESLEPAGVQLPPLESAAIAASPNGYLRFGGREALSAHWIRKDGTFTQPQVVATPPVGAWFEHTSLVHDGTHFIVSTNLVESVDERIYAEPTKTTVRALVVTQDPLQVVQQATLPTSIDVWASDGAGALGASMGSKGIQVWRLTDNGVLAIGSPAQIASVAHPQSARLIWGNGLFLLVWQTHSPSGVWGHAIAPDGSLIGSQFAIAEWEGQSGIGPSLDAAYIDDHFVVTWFQNDGASVQRVHQRRMDSAMQLDAPTVLMEPAYSVTLSPRTTGGAVAFAHHGNFTRLGTYSGDSVSATGPLVTTPPAQNEAALAVEGDRLLAAFTERTTAAYAIGLAELTLSDPPAVAQPPSVVATLGPDVPMEGPAVASEAGMRLVAWSERSDPPRVRAVRVDAAGVVLDAVPLALASESSGVGGDVAATRIQAAGTEGGFLVSHEFNRFNTVGSFEHRICLNAITTAGEVSQPSCTPGSGARLLRLGQGAVMTWNAWSPIGVWDASNGGLGIARVSADGSLGPRLDLGEGYTPILAANANHLLVGIQRVPPFHAQVLDAETLDPLHSAQPPPSFDTVSAPAVAAAFGDGFAAVWTDQAKLYGASWNKDGDPTSPIINLAADVRAPAIGQAGGATLMAIPKLDPETGAMRVVIRTLAPSPSLDAGSPTIDASLPVDDPPSAEEPSPAAGLRPAGGCSLSGPLRASPSLAWLALLALMIARVRDRCVYAGQRGYRSASARTRRKMRALY